MLTEQDMFFRKWLIWFAVLLLLLLQSTSAWACYAVVVGREASADGSVLVGHNEQNGGRRVLNFRRVPRRKFQQGATVRLWRGGELPQVGETAAMLWSENPGLEFSDAYLNEWGVAVVSDACRTREDGYEALSARGGIRDGGIGYMLRRLVAERARSARQGVELAGKLVERFGYVDSGRTYVIADPREAWLVAVVRGRRWVARRVPDDAVVLLPNVHIIEQINLADSDRFLASPDVIDYAAKRGWFDPDGGRPFSFRRAYAPPDHQSPDLRRWRGRWLVTGQAEPWPPERPFSFGVKPKRKMTVAAVAAILRDREGPVPLSTPATQEGAVFQLRCHLPEEIGCVYWRTTAEPATSVLTPWYLGITETPAACFRGSDVETQVTLRHHFEPPPGTFEPDPRLAWWTFKRLQDLVNDDFDRRAAIVRPVWATLEERAFRQQPGVEAEALALWADNPQAAREHLTRHCDRIAAEARAEAEKLIHRLSASLDTRPASR